MSTGSDRVLRSRVKALQKKPQPEQRTQAWFEARQTRITASEAASCLFKSEKVCEEYVKQFGVPNFKYKDTEPLNPYETREDYIIKKCNAFYGIGAGFRDSPATLWGKRYEEVANRLYQRVCNKVVHEFGLISHGRLKWLAASPDGITSDGIMLEIKCPKSRKIQESAPPLYYWIQVQIQLETCNLDECDFLECEIAESEDEQAFLQFVPGERQDIGILLARTTASGPEHIYPPMALLTHQDYIDWKNEMIAKDATWSAVYFCVTKFNVMRIKRSKEWFAAVKESLKQVWGIVMKLQSNIQDFEKYKDSINLIKNKGFMDKYNNSVCLIEDNSSVFEFEEPNTDAEDTCMIDSD